ncbi:MFS general substrate transporter [Coemansia reversa NRRL 1564]|uniref:MFS general substrate transporter n=1 Tax=Coemansia reversa (strain ATCC 12441 / NRRL 1564) TaxID=763665 RepID=A0A2G5B939_COERN|nr:MFS general substrate transporter [Coemansia reversa NRRL 1564]|eukprot:PIA15543.1 MFS general substrate transporter [Coemansia reversa NRRL 1564]
MIKKLTVCGVAFLNDAYDMFAINIVAIILGFVYYHDAEGSAQNTVPKKWDTLIKIAVQIGCLLGQLVLGRLGDKIGHTTVYSASLMIAIITTIASAFSNSMVKGFNVFIVLFIWRVLLGFGIGGDYPLTATIVSEYASPKNRGKLMAGVFAWQGFGNVLTPIVSIIVTACFASKIDADVLYLDYVWRIIIGVGCIPGVATLYWHLTMADSTRFQNIQVTNNPSNIDSIDSEDDKFLVVDSQSINISSQSSENSPRSVPVVEPQQHVKSFGQYFGEWRHLKVLLGTSIAWFALDVAFYGINLNSSVVIKAIGFAGNIREDKPSHFIKRNCLGSIIINILGSVPGYWITVFTIEKLGRKTIQLMGFGILTILYTILGFAYNQSLSKSTGAFIFLFSLAQLFQNFGPNVTTFVIPGEVFPTRFRSTAHGISAAAGKLGAIVAQVGFLQLANGCSQGDYHLLQIFGAFMLLGFFVTFWIPEPKGKTLEICGENEELN